MQYQINSSRASFPALAAILVTFFIIANVDLSAQSQDQVNYQTEFSAGINKNTFGGAVGGFVVKKAKRSNDRWLKTYGLEIVSIKHPEEQREKSQITGNRFTFGKSHYLYAFRFQYGRDMIFLKKGIEMKAVAAIGPTVGIVAPYYVERASNGGFVSVYVPFTPEIRSHEIYGTGKLFQGIDESHLVAGANVKLGINAQLQPFKNGVVGLEAGFLLDAYSRKIEIVPEAKSYSTYPTLFATLFFGIRK